MKIVPTEIVMKNYLNFVKKNPFEITHSSSGYSIAETLFKGIFFCIHKLLYHTGLNGLLHLQILSL